MKCPKCGSEVRPSKKYPGYYLCDTCKKRYPGSSVHKKIETIDITSQEPQIEAAPEPEKEHSKKRCPFFLLFFILLIMAASFAGLYFSGMLDFEEPAVPQKENITQLSMAETAILDHVQLKILSTEFSNGNDLIRPSNGSVFLLINIEITNISDTELTINSVSDFTAYNNGVLISYDSAAYDLIPEKTGRLNSTVAPNSTVTGYVCYEVPSDWTTIILQYSNPMWSFQKIQFEITNPP